MSLGSDFLGCDATVLRTLNTSGVGDRAVAVRRCGVITTPPHHLVDLICVSSSPQFISPTIIHVVSRCAFVKCAEGGG